MLEAFVVPVAVAYAVATYSSNATVGKVEKGVDSLERGLAEVKADVTALRCELKNEVSALRGELKNAISELKSELKNEMSELKSELKNEMSELKNEMSALRGELKDERFFVLGVVVLLGGMGSTALYQVLKPR